MISRRRFLSAGLVGLSLKAEPHVEGGFVNDAFPLGHRLRDRAGFTLPKRVEKVSAVIAGGGIAGLSAAWRLNKRGFTDFVLLEMEGETGGNSRGGMNEVSAYPWAAHYLPVPNPEAVYVRELCEELGVLEKGVWNERYLCFAPQERLFLHGRWQEGLEPDLGVPRADKAQYREFESRMQELRSSAVFTVPMEIGAKPSELDRISMSEWMRLHKFDSAYLRWYADYSCRDDYGTSLDRTSAFAGVHYFAARAAEEKGPLTWPEGNAWLARRMAAKVEGHVRRGAPVFRIQRDRQRYRVFTPTVEYQADAVIFAAPTFLAPYVIEGAPAAAGFEYAPWLVANLTLSRLPMERGAELAWDNVLYGSPSLGYVVADHMSLGTRRDRSVWTYYWAFAEGAAADARKELLGRDWGYWKDRILDDLSRAHPDIRQCVSRVDIMRHGHAMIRPTTGFLFSEQRLRWLKPQDRLFHAHSSLSGISIFEEAQYRGVMAADGVMRVIGKS